MIRAQEKACEFGHRGIGCEHPLSAVAESRDPAGAALTGAGNVFDILDGDALATRDSTSSYSETRGPVLLRRPLGAQGDRRTPGRHSDPEVATRAQRGGGYDALDGRAVAKRCGQ